MTQDITIYKKDFFRLLEYKSGDVKPVLNEQNSYSWSSSNSVSTGNTKSNLSSANLSTAPTYTKTNDFAWCDANKIPREECSKEYCKKFPKSCSPESFTIEDYRNFIESLPMSTLLTIASFTPLKPIPIVLYGILVVDDVSKCINGNCDWINLILDLVSCIGAPAIGKAVKPFVSRVVGACMKYVKTFGSNIPKWITYIAKVSKRLKLDAMFKKCMEYVKSGINLFKNIVSKISTEVNKYMGLPKFFYSVAKWLKSNQSKVLSTIDSIQNGISESIKFLDDQLKQNVSKIVGTNKSTKAASAVKQNFVAYGAQQQYQSNQN